MKLRILVGSIVFFLVASACGFNINVGGDRIVGSGKQTTETRQVSGFDQVVLEGSGEVYLEQGEKESLTVEADDNLIAHVKTDVVGRRLELGMKPNVNYSSFNPVIYRLTVKDLNSLTLAGSGKISAKPLSVSNFSLSLPGSGDITFDKLDAKDVHIILAGSGNIKVSAGSAESVDLNLAGSGNFDAAAFKTGDANTILAGSGKVILWPSGKLTGHILGSGEIQYYGAPTTVDIKTTGSGTVKSLGGK